MTACMNHFNSTKAEQSALKVMLLCEPFYQHRSINCIQHNCLTELRMIRHNSAHCMVALRDLFLDFTDVHIVHFETYLDHHCQELVNVFPLVVGVFTVESFLEPYFVVHSFPPIRSECSGSLQSTCDLFFFESTARI